MYVGQGRDSSHFSFDGFVKALGPNPGIGVDYDVLMDWPAIGTPNTRKLIVFV